MLNSDRPIPEPAIELPAEPKIGPPELPTEPQIGPPEPPPSPRRKSITRRLVNLALLAITGTIMVAWPIYYYMHQPPQEERSGSGRGGRTRNADGPVPVVAVSAQVADVPVYLDGVGSARALNTVTVRAQVDGKLISIAFREGQDVARGDLLAKIDPAIYQAQLDQVIAKKAQDEAQLANARLDLERYRRLAQTNSGSRQQADTQQALVAQLEALVQFDQAAIDNARAFLAYTTITAPIDGRTGIRMVDEGNIVRASDVNGLVVITQIRPIAVFFNLPQQQLGKVNAAFAKGALSADALDGETQNVIDRGKLLVVDNQVDQTTGTVRMKAEFPNAELQLWPGQFVTIRLLIDTLRQVVVVPTAAVQRGPNGTFIYVVKDNAATLRPVTIGQQDDRRTVIAKGLDASERVVTTGFARLTDGAQVRITEGDESGAPPPVAVPDRPRRQPGGGGGGQRRRDPPQAGDPPPAGSRPRGGAGEGRPDTPRGQRSDAPPGRAPL